MKKIQHNINFKGAGSNAYKNSDALHTSLFFFVFSQILFKYKKVIYDKRKYHLMHEQNEIKKS